MSFGYSVGDFIAICQLANQLHERFVEAPKQFKAISNELRGLSDVLQHIERVFAQRVLSEWQNKALVSILEECHNVLTELGKLVDENYYFIPSNVHGLRDKSRRAWKRLTWEPNDIQELRSRIALNVGLLNAFNGSLISEVTLETKNQVERLHERQDVREHGEIDRNILDWLTPIGYAAQQNDLISRRQAGTGQWFLDSTEFHTWMEADNQTMFCPGIPGSGKTILTSAVVEKLTSHFRNDKTIGIAYFYCNFRRKTEQKAEDLLASLLRQLIESQSPLPESLRDLYNTSKGSLSYEEISRSISVVTAMYSRVFVIIDALDETSAGCRAEFLREVFGLQEKFKANIFATSRFIPEVVENFKGCITLEIRALEEDVREYLESRILNSGQKLLQAYREEIKTGITKAVDGMFLLAQLNFESISTKKTLKKMKDVLNNLPTGPKAYDYAYEDAMKRIAGHDPDSKELAMQVLSWIAYSKTPLTTSELQCALAVELGETELDVENLSQIEDMVSVCAGLVTVDEESNIVRLVHYTMQEYFERMKTHLFPRAESEIIKACVTYLSFSVFGSGYCPTEKEFVMRLASHKLYEYASCNWGHHAHGSPTSIEEVVGFLEKKAHVEASTQSLVFAKGHYKQYTGHTGTLHTGGRLRNERWTGLHLAAYFGIEPAVQFLLEKGANTVARNCEEEMPVHLAACKGHIEVVKLLLENRIDVATAADISGWTPLHCAASHGNVEMVKLLLGKEVDMEATTKSGETSLSEASRQGNIEVVKLLLEKGVNTETSTYSNHRTPLHQASSHGRIEVVKLLLEQGANVDATDHKSAETPLFLATRDGHIEVVKFLLEKGVYVDTTNAYGATPLQQASMRGQIEMARILLERGADVGVTNRLGETPLFLASASNSYLNNGHIETARLLIEKGCNPEISRNDGCTPLHQASRRGHIEMARMLLERGADVEAINELGETPLFLASGWGDTATVKLLIEKGANPETSRNDGSTPLKTASINLHFEVVMMLLKNTKIKYPLNQFLLINAIKQSKEAVVKFLLEEMEFKARELDPTLLPWAIESGNEAIVKLLLGVGGIAPDSKGRTGRTPLLHAAIIGNKAMVELLLATNQVDVDSKEHYGFTPLSMAARHGWKEVLSILLTHSCDLDSKDNFNRTPLWWARRTGNSDIADLLIEKCEERGITIQEDGLPPPVFLPQQYNTFDKFCDICDLYISIDDAYYYHCDVCCKGDFDICEDCFTRNAYCLDRSHPLIRRVPGSISTESSCDDD